MKRPLRILVTAGPTREMFDPVRFISNVSTGEMGYAVARQALMSRHRVTLISGPTALERPKGAKFISIVSAADLKHASDRLFPKHDVLIMTAAVCDFTAAKYSDQKIRRAKTQSLSLKKTPDILAGLAKQKEKRIVIGFCLETQNWLVNAKKKLAAKDLDGIVANYYDKKHIPFGNRAINTAFLEKSGKNWLLRKQSKALIAKKLIHWAETLVEKGHQKG